MAPELSLDGGMIPRTAERVIDERTELRHAAVSGTAVLEFRGRRHVVRLSNISRSGAMIVFAHVPHIGEEVQIHLLDRGAVSAQVIWAKAGRVGLSFTGDIR